MTRKTRGERKRGSGKISLDLLYRTRIVGGGHWSNDGQWVAFTTNFNGRHNIYVVPSTGGWPLQLTVSDQRQVIGDWSPDGEWIAFQSDFDGNEQWDLFTVSTATGEVRNLTSTPEISEESPRFSPRGRRLAFLEKPRAGSSYEVRWMEWPEGIIHPVTSDTPPDWSYSGPVWAPDGRKLAFTRTRADHKVGEIWVADLRTATLRKVSEPGEALWRAVDFSPDGQTMLAVSDALNGFANVVLVRTRTGATHWITNEQWECDAGAFHPSGRQVVWEVNRDGNGELWATDLQTGRARPIIRQPGLSASAPGGYSPEGKRILYSYSGPREPQDLYVREIRSGRTVRVTNSNMAGLDNSLLVQPTLVRYRSEDGLEIPAWVYVPRGVKKNGGNPAVIHVHGGPSAQVVNGFQRGIQYLVNNGYVVIAPNYRGSTGYGKGYEEKNRFDMGGGDLSDVVSAARHLASTGLADPRRVGIMGGSYGGYMTMLALGKAPEVWAAGVAIVPFVNWFTEIENEDPILRQWDLATMGDPVTNRKLYEERSPINFVNAIRAPVLILAGANDPRCPKSESDQVVQEITRNRGVVEYKFYENEGHGFARTENAVDSFRRTVEFLDRYLKK
jgi:dipeptidyl aminopeptidase/acylaminoacyl peptidase